MDLFDEVEKKYSNILSGYDEEAKKMSETDDNYIQYMSFVRGIKNLLDRRNLKYEVVVRELEIELLGTPDIDKLFKNVYKKLDKILKNTLKNIKKYIPWYEIRLKKDLLKGIKEEHEKYLNYFKNYESEVRI